VVIPSNTGRKEVFPISSKQAESFAFILHRAEHVVESAW
jgi:hypothetical protein